MSLCWCCRCHPVCHCCCPASGASLCLSTKQVTALQLKSQTEHHGMAGSGFTITPWHSRVWVQYHPFTTLEPRWQEGTRVPQGTASHPLEMQRGQEKEEGRGTEDTKLGCSAASPGFVLLSWTAGLGTNPTSPPAALVLLDTDQLHQAPTAVLGTPNLGPAGWCWGSHQPQLCPMLAHGAGAGDPRTTSHHKVEEPVGRPPCLGLPLGWRDRVHRGQHGSRMGMGAPRDRRLRTEWGWRPGPED